MKEKLLLIRSLKLRRQRKIHEEEIPTNLQEAFLNKCEERGLGTPLHKKIITRNIDNNSIPGHFQ